jgi:dTDP-4-amino-4,6-dideoxygalactose transaminase
MHALAIAVSRNRLQQVNQLIADRHKRFNRLSEHLRSTGVMDPPVTREGAFRGSWQGYCAMYDASRTGVPLDKLVQALRAEGLEVTPRGYHLPLHYSRIFQTRGDGQWTHTSPLPNRRTYRRGDFPNAERHIEQLIGFPLFMDEGMELIDAYGEACRKVCENLDELRS